MDTKQIKNSVDIVEVVTMATNQTLQREGHEMVGLCPFHKEKSPSFKVNRKKQMFKCFGCGEGGDVLEFLQKLFEQKAMNKSDAFKAAIKWIQESKGQIAQPPKRAAAKKAPWKQLPTGARPATIVHYRHGKPDQVWEYKNADDKLIGFICRFNLPDGSKEVCPYSYCTDGNRNEWRWRAFEPLRPLYGWQNLIKFPSKNVMIVEGEKTADAAQILFPHLVVVAWPGGTNSIKLVNWELLSGKVVILWPDNDTDQKYSDNHPEFPNQIKPFLEQPGNKAMIAIAGMLSTIAKGIHWIMNSPEFPHKWDLADAHDWTPESARKYAQANLCKVPTENPKNAPIQLKKEQVKPIAAKEQSSEVAPMQEKKQEVKSPDNRPSAAPVPDEFQSEHVTDANSRYDHTAHFEFLGYEKESDSVTYCFYVRESKTVHKYSAGGMGRLSVLISLAPLDFWETMFSSGRTNKVKVEFAMNWMVRASHAVGFFSSDRLRGRGAWMDRGRTVFHAGDHLVVNGERVALGDLSSKYIYEAGFALGYSMDNPLGNADANKLMVLTKAMNWTREINAYLLAGWCVVAPVCGALNWRPHIWITGSAGSGKSWTLKEIVRRLLGLSALAVQSETTEPGLRQLIKSDALPVVFDEMDAEDMQQQYSIKKVLGLMRAASADDGGYLVKGTSSGAEKKYRIRSCFAFGSIGISATQQSDRTRITILSLNTIPDTEEKDKKWERLQRLHNETITDEFALSLQARTLKYLPVIVANAKVFAKAAASLLGKQRLGDQVGSLLAGAYSLYSINPITLEDAIDWIKDKDWNEEKELEETRDENRLLNHLMERLVKVDRASASTVERTIGELVGIASELQKDGAVVKEQADRKIRQLGIRIEGDTFIISNASGHIRKYLYKTPWQSNWAKILMRIDSAQSVGPSRFTTGNISRGVAIPLDILKVYEPPKPPLLTEDELPF